MERVHKELGISGTGVKVAISSTGANVVHEGLVNSYAGLLKNGSFDHNYNWFDAYGSPVPIDTRFAGNHIAGVAVGSKYNIGVAPAAKFIACRALDELERDSPESHIKCLEFFHRMHDLNGENSRLELIPDVVFTSYSDTSAAGVLRPAIQELLNAAWW